MFDGLERLLGYILSVILNILTKHNCKFSLNKIFKRLNKNIMRLQVIHDGQGKSTGVFIPIEDWTLIKNQFPGIENADNNLEQWEKNLIDTRLDAIDKNPERLKDGKNLLSVLKGKI